MIQHFQFKNMFENKQLPGWTFSFYYQRNEIHGNYHKDGRIEWTGPIPPD